MKIEKAISNANKIAARVRSVNGIIATPLCEREAVRIKRIWVFGSTVKGSKTPNDLDLLIDMESVGRRFTWKSTQVDRRYYRTYGIKRAPCSLNSALIWLSKGMHRVSRHILSREAVDIDVKVMIYPRSDLPSHFAKINSISEAAL